LRRAALPRLQQLLVEANDREYVEGWTAQYDRVAVLRDEAAERFARYPVLVGELVEIFRRAEEVDQEVSGVNRSAPSGELRRLRCVELTARGLEAFSSAIPAICKSAQLPDWADSCKKVWPPPAPSIDPSAFMPVLPHPGADWWRDNEARAAERRSEAERVAAHYRAQECAREERENAAARVGKGPG
jgi:hypothetical protein